MQFEGKEKHIYILSFTNTVHNNHVFTRPPTYTCTDEYKETLKHTKKYPLEKKLRNFFFYVSYKPTFNSLLLLY